MMTETIPAGGHVRGWPRALLRVEGAAALLLAVALYFDTGQPWLLFAILFLAPDLSFAGYLAGPRVGAVAYNAVHSYAGPLLLAVAALGADAGGTTAVTLAVALTWGAHIGFDRMLGYGLKYGTGFGETHLGQVGKAGFGEAGFGEAGLVEAGLGQGEGKGREGRT
jgi:hypothetical protein